MPDAKRKRSSVANPVVAIMMPRTIHAVTLLPLALPTGRGGPRNRTVEPPNAKLGRPSLTTVHHQRALLLPPDDETVLADPTDAELLDQGQA